VPEDLRAIGKELVGAARPEKIAVSFEAKSGWQKVRVEIVQPTGADTILQVKAGDTPITLLQSGFITLDEGTELWIEFDPDTLNFFDPDSGANTRQIA